MEYKQKYSEADVKALIDSVKGLAYEGRLDIGGGQVLINAKESVANLVAQVEPHIGNVCYSGMIHKLSVIRDKLVEQGYLPST